MAKQNMNTEIMEYMVWVVEIAAEAFFSDDKGTAYNTLKEIGIWDFYVDTYDTTHTLGAEVIKDEILEWMGRKERVTT